MMTVDRGQRASASQAQIVLSVASLVAYAVGYPLAIVGGYAIGWAFVTLGGVLLLALGVITVRRIHRGTSDS